MSDSDNKKEPKKNKSNCIMLRLDDDEYNSVLANAQKAGLAPAVFVRHCALNRQVIPKAQRKIYGKYFNQLSWIGNNINQIAKALNYLCNQKQRTITQSLDLAQTNLTLSEIHNELILLRQIIEKDSEK